MLFWHIWYSREAYDEFYKFAQKGLNHYNIDAINKLRLVDVSLGWSRIDRIGEFVRMGADQRLSYLIYNISAQTEEFNVSDEVTQEFLQAPLRGIKQIHKVIMDLVEYDAWLRFGSSPNGRPFLQMPKPRLAPDYVPHDPEQARPVVRDNQPLAARFRTAPAPVAPAPVVPAPAAPALAPPATPFRRPAIPAGGNSLAPNAALQPPPAAPFHRPVITAGIRSIAPNEAIPPPPAAPLPAVVVIAPASVAARAREIRDVLPAPSANVPALIVRPNVSYIGKPLPKPPNTITPPPKIPDGGRALPPTPARRNP